MRKDFTVFWEGVLAIVGNLVAVAALALMGVMMLCGCQSRRAERVYVPVESVRVVHDSVGVSRSLLDRIVERDTVREYMCGDTVFVDRVQWRVREKAVHDTVERVRRDSVAVAVPYEVRVAAELSAWERFKLSSWGLMAGVLAGLALWHWLRWKRG